MNARRFPVGLGALTLGVVGMAATWRADGPGSATTLDGATVFQLRGCTGCHVGPGTASLTAVGPSLVGAADWAGERRPGLSAEAYLGQSMRAPGAFRSPAAPAAGAAMPDLALTDEEVEALVLPVGRMTTLTVVSDDAAFEARLGDAQARARRVAAFVLGTPEGADDVVQTAGERAWRARDRYDPARPFDPWFLRIVANAARNDRRARGRRGRLRTRAADTTPLATATTPEDDAVAADDRRRALAALNRLEADDRTVLALRYVEGLDEATTAEVLDCPVGTVKSRASRAKARLRALLEESPA